MGTETVDTVAFFGFAFFAFYVFGVYVECEFLTFEIGALGTGCASLFAGVAKRGLFCDVSAIVDIFWRIFYEFFVYAGGI